MSKANNTNPASTKRFFGVVDKSVGNYEKHPFFVKKAKEAKELLRKVGLPEELVKKK